MVTPASMIRAAEHLEIEAELIHSSNTNAQGEWLDKSDVDGCHEMLALAAELREHAGRELKRQRKKRDG